MSYKITKKHFKIFKSAVQDWLEIYGLKDWLVNIEYGIDKDYRDGFNGDVKALCVSNLIGMQAAILIDNQWDDEPTEQKLKETAFHEATELLLAPLNIMAVSRYVTESEIDTARHAIIQRLYNTVCQDKYRK